MILSILIPTLKSREFLFNELRKSIQDQIDKLAGRDQVEILSICDSGEISIGAKRNRLLHLAKGKYIAFVDDDDAVSENYVEKVLRATESDPDVVGMRLTHFVNGKLYGNTIHSLQYENWQNIAGPDGIWKFFRNPNHLNPVRRELAIEICFPDKSVGEDKDYSMNILRLLKNETMIDDEPIYYYMEQKD